MDPAGSTSRQRGLSPGDLPPIAVAPSTLTTVLNADITTTADPDYYIFTVPSGTSGTERATVTSAGQSLLSPNLQFIDSDKKTVLATASGANQYGTSVSVSVAGMAGGKK